MKNLVKLLMDKNLSNNIITFIIVIILPVLVFGQGSLTDISFYSNSLNMIQNMQVYLPEEYNPQDAKRYPVVYFLHGALATHTSNPELIGILDNLIEDLTISPVIVVKPDGSVGPWGGSMYTNSELYGSFEDYIVYDLVEFIDTTYKTISNRDKRVIMGHSMGGYGSMKLAFKHPDIYRGAASHNGPLDFNHFSLWVPTILAENGGAPVSSYNPNKGIATLFLYTVAGAFSPNLNNTPYPVDFPLDSTGNFIDSTFNRWLIHDPARLCSNITPESNLAIYFDCGEQDEVFLHPFNIGFADSLDALGLNYVFKSYEGTHNNQGTKRFPIVLSFLDSVMNISTGLFGNHKNSLSSFNLYQNYPNPFNPSTKIEFTLPKSEYITLKVYNILGEEITTIVNNKLQAGNHTYEFDGSNLASGVYLYRIEAGEYNKVMKMILIK